MRRTLLITALALAVLNTVADTLDIPAAVYILKPLATLVILATYDLAQWGIVLSVSADDGSLAAGDQPLRVG